MATPIQVINGILRFAQPPSLSAQLSLCLDSFDGLLETAGNGLSARQILLENIADSFTAARTSLAQSPITASVADLIPAPPAQVDAMSACLGDPATEHLGVWLTPTTTFLETIRKNKLAAIDLLTGETKLAVNVPLGTITLFVQQVWSYLTSQNSRLDDSGEPDVGGSVELRSATLTSPTNQSILLTVKGTYHTFVNVDFSATLSETLTVMQFAGTSWVQSSVTSNISIDESSITAIEVGLGLLSQFFGFPGAAAGIASYDEIQAYLTSTLAEVRANLPLFGIGGVILSLLPSKILIPETALKISFSYDGVDVDLSPSGSGMTVTSSKLPVLGVRNPTVFISGPDSIAANIAIKNLTQVSRVYSGLYSDLRTPFNSVEWTGDAQFTFSADDTMHLQPSVSFNIKGLGTRTITLSITDADDVTKSVSYKVKITTYDQPVTTVPTKPKIPVTME